MALIEVEEVALAAPGGDLHGYGIDGPQSGERSDSFGLDVRGWVIGARAPATAIELLRDEVLVRRVPVEIERPDVADAHRELEGAGRSGFFATIGALDLDPGFELLVRARLEDRTRVPLATIKGSRDQLRSSFDPRVDPLMVTTLGRTGSTAVVRLLGAHPEIVAYRPFEYEPRVATYWMGVLKELSHPASYRRQIAPGGPLEGPWWLSGDAPLPRPARDPELNSWLGGAGVEELAGFCQSRIEALYSQIGAVAGRPDAAYFAEKFRPDRIPALIGELYPGAREIVLVRDFRDMLSSMFAYNAKRGVQGFRRDRSESDTDYVLDRVRGSVNALASAWRARERKAHLLRYEDLVLRPRETVEALLGYLGLAGPEATVEAMLSSLETAESEGHRTVADPKETIGRWQRDLSEEVQAACQEALGPSLAAFGYAEEPA